MLKHRRELDSAMLRRGQADHALAEGDKVVFAALGVFIFMVPSQ